MEIFIFPVRRLPQPVFLPLRAQRASELRRTFLWRRSVPHRLPLWFTLRFSAAVAPIQESDSGLILVATLTLRATRLPPISRPQAFLTKALLWGRHSALRVLPPVLLCL